MGRAELLDGWVGMLHIRKFPVPFLSLHPTVGHQVHQVHQVR